MVVIFAKGLGSSVWFICVPAPVADGGGEAALIFCFFDLTLFLAAVALGFASSGNTAVLLL